MGTTTSGDEDIALSYKWKMDPASRKWSRDDSAISSFSKSSKSQIVKRSCSTPITYKQRNVSEIIRSLLSDWPKKAKPRCDRLLINFERPIVIKKKWDPSDSESDIDLSPARKFL